MTIDKRDDGIIDDLFPHSNGYEKPLIGQEVGPAVAALINDVKKKDYSADRVAFLAETVKRGVKCMVFQTPGGLEIIPTELIKLTLEKGN